MHLSVYPYLANSTDRLMWTLLGNCSVVVGGGACLSLGLLFGHPTALCSRLHSQLQVAVPTGPL